MDLGKQANRIRDWFITTANKLTALKNDGLSSIVGGVAVAVYTGSVPLTILAMAGSILIYRGGKWLFVDRKEQLRIESNEDIEWAHRMLRDIWDGDPPIEERKRLTDRIFDRKKQDRSLGSGINEKRSELEFRDVKDQLPEGD